MEMLCGLYVITDNVLSGRSHEEIARAALAGGARILQLRDKRATDAELLPVAQTLRQLCTAAGAVFIVNDRVELAAEAEADGVHLGAEDETLEMARRRLGAGKIIGRSVDSVAEGVAAQEAGADYVALGPIFGTQTKPDAGEARGVAMLRELRSRLRVPLVAIGGIHAGNVAEVVKAGADAVAIISAVVCAPDVQAATAELVARMEAARAGDKATHPPNSFRG